MRQRNKKFPPLIKTEDGLEGFESGKLWYYFQDIGMGEKWKEFINGQTGAVIKGKFIVYKSDVERFIAGKPVID